MISKKQKTYLEESQKIEGKLLFLIFRTQMRLVKGVSISGKLIDAIDILERANKLAQENNVLQISLK